MSITTLTKLYESRIVERNLLHRNIRRTKRNLERLENETEDTRQAKEVLVNIELKTQQLFQSKIENLVTPCLQGIFERDYRLVINIQEKRNQTECKFYIKKGKLILDPNDTMGGGVVDVGGLACRVVLFRMERPRKLGILFFDEPLKWVHGFEEEASRVIRRLSHTFNIQFIIISQIEALSICGDKVFYVDMDEDGVSHVTIVS